MAPTSHQAFSWNNTDTTHKAKDAIGLCQLWFKKWLGAISAPSHFLNQCWQNQREKLQSNTSLNNELIFTKIASMTRWSPQQYPLMRREQVWPFIEEFKYNSFCTHSQVVYSRHKTSTLIRYQNKNQHEAFVFSKKFCCEQKTTSNLCHNFPPCFSQNKVLVCSAKTRISPDKLQN